MWNYIITRAIIHKFTTSRFVHGSLFASAGTARMHSCLLSALREQSFDLNPNIPSRYLFTIPFVRGVDPSEVDQADEGYVFQIYLFAWASATPLGRDSTAISTPCTG